MSMESDKSSVKAIHDYQTNGTPEQQKKQIQEKQACSPNQRYYR